MPACILIKVLKLRQVVHHARALASGQAGFPRAHILDQDGIPPLVISNKVFLRAIFKYGFALNDEMNCDLCAEFGAWVEVTVEELLEIGFRDEVDTFGIVASCDGLLGFE